MTPRVRVPRLTGRELSAIDAAIHAYLASPDDAAADREALDTAAAKIQSTINAAGARLARAGRVGGAVSSPAKRKAARANGRRGGRPVQVDHPLAAYLRGLTDDELLTWATTPRPFDPSVNSGAVLRAELKRRGYKGGRPSRSTPAVVVNGEVTNAADVAPETIRTCDRCGRKFVTFNMCICRG